MTEEVRAFSWGGLSDNALGEAPLLVEKESELPEQLKLGAQSRYEDVIMVGTSHGPYVFKFRVGRRLAPAAGASSRFSGWEAGK